MRRELLRQYMRLQRLLMEEDPGTSEYQGAIREFREMGYVMISSGFEDDLDRLLRIRLLDGGLDRPALREARGSCPELHVMEHVRI